MTGKPEPRERPAPQLGEPDEHPLSVLLFSWMRTDFFLRLFLAVLAAVCAVLVALEFVIPGRPAVATIEGLPGFFGVFGFLAFGLAVLSGWPLGRLMRRPEDYYDPQSQQKERDHDG
jgi:hypothetical protein